MFDWEYHPVRSTALLAALLTVALAGFLGDWRALAVFPGMFIAVTIVGYLLENLRR